MKIASQQAKSDASGLAFNEIPVPIVVLGPDLRVRQYSAATVKLLGLEPGKPEWSLREIEDKLQVQALGRTIEETLASQQLFEKEVQHKDGRWFLMRIHPFKNAATGKPDGVTVAFADIDASKRKSEQRAKKLAASGEELKKFVSMAAHDLKEPLAVVSIYTELLAENNKDAFNEESLQHVQSIQDTIKKMLRLIDDLLKFSRMSLDNPFRPVNTNQIFDQAVAGLKKQIELANACVIREQLPEIQGEPQLLLQLFQNLISNAVKFRSDVPPSVHVTAEAGKTEWLFSFKDNGIGIAPEYTVRIFEMFERVHDKRKYEGSGLGLAVCKKVAEHHGGRIWVESEEGKGSNFLVALPLSPSF